MPVRHNNALQFRISAFQTVKPGDQPIEGLSRERNYIYYVEDGNCTISVFGKEMRTGQRTLVYVARGIKYRIRAEKKDRCVLRMLELSETDGEPHLDLQELCAKHPLVGEFMGAKSRCCILIDCENIYSTVNELIGELEADYPEKQLMVSTLLRVLYIKMARSYQLHGKPSGVQYITDAKRFIGDHYNQELSVQMIADHLGISRSYLQILFSRYGKRSIVEHINGVRTDKAAYLLAKTGDSVLDIALATGYNSRQHFTRAFREHMGVTPREYRKKHRMQKGDERSL